MLVAKKIFYTVILTIFLTLVAGPSYAKTLIVDSTADAPDPPRLTLREAIAQAMANDTVLFSPNLSGQTIVLNTTSGSLLITRNINITAADLPAGITIDGNGGGSVFVVSSAVNGIFNNLTITRAGTNGLYGLPNSTMSLTNCRITDNHGAYAGGGIRATHLNLNNCTVSKNTASSNGGGLVGSGNVTMTNCTISDNEVMNEFGYGGGASVVGVNLSITNTVFRNNVAPTAGALDIMLPGRAQIDGCIFEKNRCTSNGNVSVSGGTITISNTTFDSNRATGSRSGLFVFDSDASVTNCTFVNNQSDMPLGNSGCIFLLGKKMRLQNTTIENNRDVGVRVDFGNAQISSCQISHNIAGGVRNYATLDITSSNIGGNGSTQVGIDGGIRNIGGGILTIENSDIGQNIHSGIANDYMASAVVRNSRIHHNGESGIKADGDVNLFRCLIDHNINTNTGNAGGIHCAGLAVIEESTVENNRGTLCGGILCLAPPTIGTAQMTLSYSTVSDNEATTGPAGGIAVIVMGLYAHLKANNCTVSGNRTVNGNGGGIYFDPGLSTKSSLKLTANSITNNHAGGSGRGGGVFLQSNAGLNIRELENNLIAGNSDAADLEPDISGGVMSEGYNLIGKMDGSAGWIDTDQTGTIDNPLDPMIGSLENNGGPTRTHALLPGSPAINTGAPQLAGTRDQRGVIRDALPDIGAYESDGRNSFLRGRVEKRLGY